MGLVKFSIWLPTQNSFEDGLLKGYNWVLEVLKLNESFKTYENVS